MIKSEINVVSLHIAFAIALFVIASSFFNYIYKDILSTVVNGITQSILSGDTSSDYITSSLEILKSDRFLLFALIIFLLTLIFTYLVAKITLRPAKQALDSQKRFISDIAHELRTPLSVVKTNSEVFLMDDGLDSKVRAMVTSNIEELDRMSDIINNLLSLSNLVRPGKIKFTDVDLGSIVDSAVLKLKDLAGKKHLEIIVKKITPHVVWGNNVALEQIAINLLKNAINYTGDNGQITIRISPDYLGNIILHIEDTGIGITKDDLLHIFEPFYRAESSRNRKRGSSGLGLTIVSELVKMHAGRITIKSTFGKGTAAIVTLPFSDTADKSEENVEISTLNEISVNFLQKKKD